jgi:hypothetical protein
MISLLFRFTLLVALGVGVALWLVDELRLDRAPKLRTVHLEEVVDGALDRARDVVEALPRAADTPPDPEPAAESKRAAVPEFVEEVIEEPRPFLEEPLPEADAQDRADDPSPEDAPVVVAARDQDQWARLIRRMLDLYPRTEPR